MRSTRWFVPLGLLVVSLLAYAPFIPQLGFYWDDWPHIYLMDNGLDYWSFFAHNRPFSAWTYEVMEPLLGTNALAWHSFVLVLRWLLTLGVWWTFTLSWPGYKKQMTWAAFLFAVYPAFTLQPIAVAFSQHFTTYGLFVLSMGAMLAAQRNSQRFWVWTGLALFAQFIHMATMEYLWGLELIRPVLLWVVIAKPGATVKQNLINAAKAWGLYFLVYAALLVWRFFFLTLPGDDPNELVLLDQIFANPFDGLLRLGELALRDLTQLLFASWTKAVNPALINLQDRFELLAWGITLVAGAFAFVLLPGSTDDAPAEKNTSRQIILIGLLAILVATVPTWLINREISVGLYNSRFALPGMFGASLVLAVGLDWLLARERYKVILLAVLIGLAAGQHLRTTNAYRWDAVKQERFFWQMSWRAPAIEPGTAIIANDSLFRYVGSYPTAVAFNSVYPHAAEYPEQTYWFFELDGTYWNNMEVYLNGVPLNGGIRNLKFEGHSSDAIVVSYDEDAGQCLWVLTPFDVENPAAPEFARVAAQTADLSNILPAGNPDPASLFGPEPAHTWCYYFQKASLAQQFGEWAEVVRLGDDAANKGYTPNFHMEWFPFISGYAHDGQWEQVRDLYAQAYAKSRQTRDREFYCMHWDALAAETSPPGRVDVAVKGTLKCGLLDE
jgi:hypothetical protein